jgi:transposase InsO family protein
LIDRIVSQKWPAERAAEAAGISRRTAFKWLKRYRSEGENGLRDRSSRPLSMPRQTPPSWQDLIVDLRRFRMSAKEIAARLKLPRSTVARVLQRAGLSRLSSLEPPEPARRYERSRPGELIHLDIKRLAKIGRVGHRIHGDRTTRVYGIGWEYVHVAIDDYSRVAYVEVLPGQGARDAIAFLRRAVRWFKGLGIRVDQILSDNGSAYRSRVFLGRCTALKLRTLKTRPYRPQTNGKAERFIQTLLREWAYARPYPNSRRRTAALPAFVSRYNRRRPHSSLHGRPPISRLEVPSEQRL